MTITEFGYTTEELVDELEKTTPGIRAAFDALQEEKILRPNDPVEFSYGSEKSKFEEFGEMQWGEADYSFDLTRVWKHTLTGDLYCADDSGCSCPSPFEDTQVKDLTPITKLQDFYDHLKDHPDYGINHPATIDQQWRLIKSIGEYLNNRES